MGKKLGVVGIVSFIFTMLFTQVISAASFKDTDGHWADSTIAWAVKEKIVFGYEDGTYRPDQSVTEAEFLALLLRSYKPSGLIEEADNWTEPFYKLAKSLNYPVHGEKDSDKRNVPIIRLTVAEIVAAVQGVNYLGSDAVHYLMFNGLSSGKNDKGATLYEKFEPTSKLTRAEAIQFIKNLKDKGNNELKSRPEAPSSVKDLYQNQTWDPGQYRLIADQFFKTYKDDGEKVSFTMVTVGNGYDFGGQYVSDKKIVQLEAGKSYSFSKGENGGITIALRKEIGGENIEAYTIHIDTGSVSTRKVADGKFIAEKTEINAILRGIGRQ